MLKTINCPKCGKDKLIYSKTIEETYFFKYDTDTQDSSKKLILTELKDETCRPEDDFIYCENPYCDFIYDSDPADFISEYAEREVMS